MPNELLFTVAGSTAALAQTVTLAEAGLRERRDLQEWIVAHPEILGPDLLIVTTEFDRWWSSTAAPADRLDVLALAKDSHLVVAELKRDRAPDTVEMQAIKYAAMVTRFTPETLAAEHARFLSQRGTTTSEDEALQRLVAHSGELDPELLQQPRIVIVAGEFPPVVTATVVWLTQMSLDIKLVQVRAYRTQQQVVITVSQLFPVKDVEEFMVTPRQAEVKAVEEKRQRQRDVSTTAKLVASGLLEDGAALRLRPDGINSELRALIDSWVSAEPKRGTAQWSNDQSGPVIWDADGQHYSPSGLAGLIVQQATGTSRSIRGGDWWVTEDGRDLVELAGELSSERERLYLDFWTRLVDRVREEHPDWFAKQGQPTRWNWLMMSSPLVYSYYDAGFMSGHRIKYELYIDK